jgi:hypothetical protein
METRKKYVNFVPITSERVRSYLNLKINPHPFLTDFSVSHRSLLYPISYILLPERSYFKHGEGALM